MTIKLCLAGATGWAGSELARGIAAAQDLTLVAGVSRRHAGKALAEVLGDARVDSDIARVGRAGTAGDIAPVVLFLCSDAARWINGANIAVDGGLEASVNAEVLGF